MGTDYTSCVGTNCPIKNSCKRFTGPKDPYGQSYFVDMPCEWHDDWFYCEYWWDNKPLKKYTMEQAKQQLNVRT